MAAKRAEEEEKRKKAEFESMPEEERNRIVA